MTSSSMDPLPCLRLLPLGEADAGDDSGSGPVYSLSSNGDMLLGRDPLCQVVVDPHVYPTVSRRHTQIQPIQQPMATGGSAQRQVFQWQVVDLGSSNGTYLNGRRLETPQILQVGDRLMLGQNGPEFILELPSRTGPQGAGPHRTGVERPVYAGAQLADVPEGPLPVPVPVSSRPGRSRDPLSLTQLFPIFSTGRELTQKAYLLPGAITVSCTVLLFLTVQSPRWFNLLLATYIAGGGFYFVYRLCGKRKPWWVPFSSAVLTFGLLTSPFLKLFLVFFREILPGDLSQPHQSLWQLSVQMFFGAGLMEELIKALPVLLFAYLGMALRGPARWRVGVKEPLDGILLGAASAAGFTLVETLGQYLPDIYQATLGAGEPAAQLASLQLLIPRLLGSVSGHMAYSGYLGYFIGLAAMRPAKGWTVMGVGYLTASVLHTLWNVAGSISPIALAGVGLISYAFLAAAILKARELSPTRSQNFATRLKR